MPDLTANQELIKSLACVALSPGLRSILIFDAPYTGLQRLATLLEPLLGTTTDLLVRSYLLGPFETDDEVWGSIALPGKTPLLRLFSPERNAEEFQLITIPDLATLSQAAARTCTMLVGAGIAHLERHEQHQIWQPRQCWLAGCARADVGKISQHLLDRFALRIQWHDIDPSARFNHDKRVASLLAHVPREIPDNDEALPPAILHQIEAANRQHVEVSPSALAHVMDFLPHEQYYPRREIALARFALALAQLAGDSALSAEHIEEAARLLGMTMKDFAEGERDGDATKAEPFSAENQAELPAELPPAQTESPPSHAQSTENPQPVYMSETTTSPSIEAGTLCSEDPYPEDTAFVEREAASLQLSASRYAPSRSVRGPIIGVEESDSLSDLAIASTIIAALKFQNIRHAHEQEKSKEIIFKHTDLRRYRRGSALEYILMILLDYTSVRDHQNWQGALLPYLSQAYTNRAGIVLIKVGAEHPVSELQAEMISARNITVPGIGEALELGSGRASPLAHGLSIAREKLRHLLQHGRAITREVTFLVISDGRGNVPGKASQRNSIQKQIFGAEGVEDALKEAAQLSTLQRVEAIVLNPQPQYYPELPELLAQALDARIQVIPLKDEVHGRGGDI